MPFFYHLAISCFINYSLSCLMAYLSTTFHPSKTIIYQNWWQWTDSLFLVAVSFPIPPSTYETNIILTKLPVNEIWVPFLNPKVGYWVVIKDYEKGSCHEKVVYINHNRYILYGNISPYCLRINPPFQIYAHEYFKRYLM